MVTQIGPIVSEHKEERSTFLDRRASPTGQDSSASKGSLVNMKKSGSRPSSSRQGSAQPRAKSGSSVKTSRPFSKTSHVRPFTAESLASTLLPPLGDEYEHQSYHSAAISDEGRLSRCLKSWMPDYEIRTLPPQPYPLREAVFSARLGENMKIIRRSNSTESIATQLSLFSCSSHGSHSAALAAAAAKQRKRRRRRLREEQEVMASNGGGGAEGEGKRSIWVELASRRGGALDKMLRMHAMYANLETETLIFQKLPDHEKVLVTEAGTRQDIKFGPGRQRSDSASNVFKKLPQPRPATAVEAVQIKRRAQSAGAKPRGPLTNFQELRRQMVSQRLASLQEKFSRHRHSSRRSITGSKSISRMSPSSVSSNNEVFQSMTPREAAASRLDVENRRPSSVFGGDEGVTEEEPKEAAQVSVWKGDSQILAIDLQRELTAKVMSRITTTTTALERATGYGDDNLPQTFVGPLEEYPNLVEEDYSHVARIPQRVRISPHLSDVIRTDIKVRMGRPRYHEIRERDLVIWNRGADLDRSHRNLKVFNWLHSLQERDFDLSLPEGVNDEPPVGDVTTKDEVVVAVDEPKIKPLFERLKKERYIV